VIANSQNSTKKRAIRDYDAWKQDHKESVWGSLFEMYVQYTQLEARKTGLKSSLSVQKSSLFDVPEVHQRFLVLEEFEYVNYENDEYTLTAKGHLASECNEGHPFLLTEYMLYLHNTISISPYTLHDVLTALAIFLGEAKENKTHAVVTGRLAEHINMIHYHAQAGYTEERKQGILYTDYWELNEEWVELMQAWLTGEYSLAQLANKYELFEGAVQKAILKLAAIVEELQALATLHSSVDLLAFLEGARTMILQDTILAESLYLRI